MRLVKRLLLVLVVLLVVVGGVGFLLPRTVRVERSATVAAPPAAVFALVNSYRRFNEWSPWAGLDPAARYAFGGPEQGKGAWMSWVGDPDKVGTGRQEITESRPFERVGSSIDFGRQGTASAAFALSPSGGGTRVTWSFQTDLGMNPFMRYMGLMFDRWIGADYEKGLAGLEKVAESLPKVDFAGLEASVVTVAPVAVASVPATSAKDEASVGKAIGSAYAEIGKFMAGARLEQAGPPITVNTRFDEQGHAFEAGIPIRGEPAAPVPPSSRVQIKRTYGGKAVKAIHRGAYRELAKTYEMLFAWANAYGFQPAGPPWDEYVTDPGKVPEAQLVTNVYLPVR